MTGGNGKDEGRGEERGKPKKNTRPLLTTSIVVSLYTSFLQCL